MKENIKKIAVIGAGMMGHGIAQSFAQAGYQVSMMSRIQKTLEKALSLVKSSEEPAYDADIAIETIAEDKNAKKTVFSQLDTCCPPRNPAGEQYYFP